MTGLDFSRLVGVEIADRHETTPAPTALPSPRVFAPTPQQEAFISALISTDRNITLEALAGCLAADTIIGINRGGKSCEVTIAHLVHMFNGGKAGGRKFDPCIPTTVRSVNRDGVVYLAEIVSAVFSGVKPTYRVATAGGFSVVATAEHQFLTPDGWVRLDWLTRNDHLICDFGKTTNGKGPKRQYRRLSAMGHHPYAHSSKPNACVWAHRLVVEAHMNGMSFEEYVKAVRAGDIEGLAFLSPEFHVHHRDNDPLNNDLDNLEILPAKEHWKHHGNTDTWQNVQAKTQPDRVIEIVPMGLQPTYDLEMKDPDNPCFLANKIAVHNSGKTSSILMGVDAYLSAFPSHELLVCAYNKSIQLEVDAKLKSRGYDWRQVGCQTVHSMGMSLLRYVYRPEIDEHKVRKLINARRDTESRTSPYWAYAPQISSLVSLGKQAAVGFFDELPIGERSVWYELADHYDVDFDGTCDIDAVVTCAQELYRQSLSITDVIDFDDMVLLPLIKSIRVKYTKDLILGDESQDWSRARQALVRMFMKPRTGRLVVVGDRNQCHPPGTRIEVFAGVDSFIEDLSSGDTVRGWNRNAQKMVAGRKVTVAKRPYSGDLLTINVGDRSTRVTPNHRLLCRWADRETPTCVTYLMWREGFGFRVGWCKLFTVSKGAISFHLAHRTRIEKADRVWILEATPSRTQASAYESIVAANWGLPTATFEPCFGATHLVPETIRYIFDNLRDNDERGRNCLIQHGRDFDLPLYPWPGMTTKTQGRRTYFEIFAANLLPGLMAVPLPDSQNRWATIDAVTRDYYLGSVYSLDVEEDHSYNADGIVVLNSIYGWTGADTRAMDRLTQELDAVVLPLSVTWRCPKKVVELAQKIVPDIQAAEDAPEGEVLRQAGLTARGESEPLKKREFLAGAALEDFDRAHPDAAKTVYLDDLTPGRDALLCRNNAPLVPLAYALIRLGIPAKVEGRKIGEGLQALVNRWQVKSTADLLRRLEDYRAREVQKHTAKGDEARAQEAEDRVDTLREIIKEVNRRGKHDIPSVIEFIDRLFADGTGGESKPCVTLATYHKSKGREWERVILIEHHSRCPSRAARQEWQKEQERHLYYVAVTRAKQTLVFAS